MAYTDEQREFYRRAKAKGWDDSKIRAGIARLGERAVAAPAAPTATLSTPPATGVQGTPSAPPAPAQAAQDDGTGWMKNWNPAEGMSALERGITGFDAGVTDLGRGIKQLVTGPEYEENARRKEALSKLGLAGDVGQVAGNVAAALPAAALAAPAGLPAAMAVGAAEGAAFGAAAPASREGERAENAMIGGAVGGLIPGAGNIARRAAGQVDPAVQRAAEVLRRYGIDTPKGDISPGPVSSFGQFIFDRTPVAGGVLRREMRRKQARVADELFNMLDSTTPTNKVELRELSEDIGGRLSRATSGQTLDLYPATGAIHNVLDEYNRLLPSQMSSTVQRHAGDLLDIAGSGKGMSSEEYQTIRSALGAQASKATPAEAKALYGLQRVLDDTFDSAVGPQRAMEVDRLREQYRLAKILRKAKIKDGVLDVRDAANKVESAANRGAVMPEAEELLSSANTAIRNIPPPNMLNTGGAILGHILASPITGSAVVARGLSNTGVPQKLAGNDSFNALMSRLLRGYTQSELSDED